MKQIYTIVPCLDTSVIQSNLLNCEKNKLCTNKQAAILKTKWYVLILVGNLKNKHNLTVIEIKIIINLSKIMIYLAI